MSSTHVVIVLLPTNGASPCIKSTPSSAHIAMTPGVSIFKCSSKNFLLNASISLRASALASWVLIPTLATPKNRSPATKDVLTNPVIPHLTLPQLESELNLSHFAKSDSSRMIKNCSRPSDAAVCPGFAGFAVQTGRDERQPP